MKSIEIVLALVLAEDAAKELEQLIQANLSVGNPAAAASYGRTLYKLNVRRIEWWMTLRRNGHQK